MSTCYQCGAELASPLFCEHCETLQPQASDMEYHALFGLSFEDDIEKKALNKTYRKLSRQVHPDFHASNVALAETLSSVVNKAHAVLSDPYQRLEYRLAHKGGASATEDKTTDKIFLMEMMELQERIEEDPQEDQRQQLEDEITTIVNSRYQRAGQALTHDDLKAARLALNEVSYCHRLLKNLHGEESIG